MHSCTSLHNIVFFLLIIAFVVFKVLSALELLYLAGGAEISSNYR